MSRYITGVIGLSTIAFSFSDGVYQRVSALVRIAGGWAADRGDQPKLAVAIPIVAVLLRATNRTQANA